ncbi:MAG: hypothetical protein MUC59_09565 [Saprospiraceae bacterium]|jgi:hypothetical protein|nr:hypothetical protein [Saprospiraceae bacterium]
MQFLTGTLTTLSFLVLCAAIALNGLVAAAFLLRKNENKRADLALAALLLAYALTALHHIFILKGVYEAKPSLTALPIYVTLSLGVLLFFSVKLRLFPTYKFEGSDLKHALLPLGQFAYFLGAWLLTDGVLVRRFYSPFYGGLEMGLYIFTFYTYQFAAYRFIRFQILALRKKKEGGQPLYETLVLRRMLRVMLLLFWVNSAYIVTDFVMYELMQLNMHDFRGFTRFGDLSFATMAGWAGLTGVQLLMKPPYVNLSTFVLRLVKQGLSGRPAAGPVQAAR